MTPRTLENRFLRYQIRAIQRFQRNHRPVTHEEAEHIALEWVARFAAQARKNWERRVLSENRDATPIRLSHPKSAKPSP